MLKTLLVATLLLGASLPAAAAAAAAPEPGPYAALFAAVRGTLEAGTVGELEVVLVNGKPDHVVLIQPGKRTIVAWID